MELKRQKSYYLEFLVDGRWKPWHHYKGVANGGRSARTRVLFALKLWKNVVRSGHPRYQDVRARVCLDPE